MTRLQDLLVLGYAWRLPLRLMCRQDTGQALLVQERRQQLRMSVAPGQGPKGVKIQDQDFSGNKKKMQDVVFEQAFGRHSPQGQDQENPKDPAVYHIHSSTSSQPVEKNQIREMGN